VSYPYIPLVTFVILAFLLSVSTITVVKLNQEHRNTKVSNGLGVAMDTGLWFRQQLDKSIFPLFALSELVKEMPIFHDLFFKIGRGGEPGSAPYRNDTVITHRNVTGICDNSTLVAAFNKIGKRVKDDADLGGALSTVNLAPMGVVCLFYPFNNTEDFTPPNYLDSTGAFGHDLFKDPKRVASATATLPSSVPVTAGPRTLVQCKGCPTAVRVAFIAMLPIVMPPGMGYNITADGKTYSVFGFVSAIINWERLLNQSNIFDRFESKGIQFELSKTDQIFNTTTNRYDFQVKNVILLCYGDYHFFLTHPFIPFDSSAFSVLQKTSVLVKSSKANNIGARNFFNVTLPTTNNNWTIGVAYEDGINAPWYQWAIAASVILSTVISILLGFILVQKQQHSNLLTEILPPKAITKLQNNIVVVDKFNMATIFQSDIIGYTSMSAEMTPIMVMKMLNSFYEGVDKLANKHKVYKIKIIGDAYVCAAGCPYACSGPDGAERIALFALDIMEYTKNFRTDGGAEISLRAGIHSGPVVAGVVGKLRPQYTLFGNSVTVAAKMESTSSKMKIQCSNITWQLLQSAPRYSFTFSNVKKEIDNHDSDTIERTWFIESAKLI
jgi:class 3 adenylate cyclase